MIFALLGLLHILHEAKRAMKVSADFKAVVTHIQGEDFTRLLTSEGGRHWLVGEAGFFLSKMKRDYVSNTVFASSSPKREASSNDTAIVIDG